jgi:hypothetical protein
MAGLFNNKHRREKQVKHLTDEIITDFDRFANEVTL